MDDSNDKKIRLMVDTTSFKNKPEPNKDIPNIQNRLKNDNSIKYWTIDEIFDGFKKGYTFVMGVHKNGAKKENFNEQTMVAIDVDNSHEGKKVSVKEVISIFEKHGFHVLGYYYTFSNTGNPERFRIIFCLDKPITEYWKIEVVLNVLIGLIPQADTSCNQSSKLFFGTNGDKQEVVILDPKATITFETALELYKPSVEIIKNKNEDLNQMIEDYDLKSYIENDTKIVRESKNYITYDYCPICHGHNDLVYWKDTKLFTCFGDKGNVTGNIINYLMATNNFKKNEAIDYFKYNLMDLPKEISQPLINIDDVGEMYRLEIDMQLKEIGMDSSFIDNITWIGQKIVNKNIVNYILCPRLAKFLRDNLNYMFVRNTANDAIKRYIYLDGYYKEFTDTDFKGIIRHLIPLDLLEMRDVNEVFNILCTDFKFVPQRKLNADQNIIVFENGVLHLDTMELKPHSPKYISTIKIPCNFIENVESPSTHYFDKYLDDLTQGDEEVKKLILQLTGVTISNVQGFRMKAAVISVGTGDTGKSKLKVLLQMLIGDENYSGIDLRRLEAKFGAMAILNKRLAGSNDMVYATIPELAVFKQVTSGDPLCSEAKGKDPMDFVFNGVLWFCCNELPKFGGDQGDWVYNRIIVIRCDNVIPKEKQDKLLEEHLYEEREYIVSLAIKELQNVIKNGYEYDIPECCKLMREKYKINNNSFRTFMEECTIPRPKGVWDNCTKRMFFDVYKAWCKDNCTNGRFEKKSEIKKILTEMGKVDEGKHNQGNTYYELFTLSDEIKEEYSCVYGSEYPKVDIDLKDYDIDDSELPF